jgi:hypothetical protein
LIVVHARNGTKKNTAGHEDQAAGLRQIMETGDWPSSDSTFGDSWRGAGLTVGWR